MSYFAFVVASKPSPIPIATVLGAFALPALFIWWAVILYRPKKLTDQSVFESFAVKNLIANFYTESTKKMILIVGLLVATILVVVFLIHSFGASDIQKCVDSGILAERSKKSKNNSNIWEYLEEQGLAETEQEKEYRIRLQCMRAMNK